MGMLCFREAGSFSPGKRVEGSELMELDETSQKSERRINVFFSFFSQELIEACSYEALRISFLWVALLGLVIEDLGSISQSGLLKETYVGHFDKSTNRGFHMPKQHFQHNLIQK
jgi:hypothetical protein